MEKPKAISLNDRYILMAFFLIFGVFFIPFGVLACNQFEAYPRFIVLVSIGVSIPLDLSTYSSAERSG